MIFLENLEGEVAVLENIVLQRVVSLMKTGLSKISKLPDGLINDLDGSMPFEFTSVNNAGTEIACIIDAGEILAWLSSNKT